jgi:hypothetical protein
MKKLICLVAIAGLGSSLFTAHAQLFGGGFGSSAAGISGAMKKLFGDNPNFTANAEVQVKSQRGSMSLPGKLFYSDGKFRIETDMAQVSGAAQIKQLGMDKLVMISLPDRHVSYVIYPRLQAYAPQTSAENQNAAKTAAGSDLKITELAKETVAGHACVKNKFEATDSDGKKHEFTVWNAADLKKFPVKIEASEDKSITTVLFKDVKFEKPVASQFEPPANYKRYMDVDTIIQQQLMKSAGKTPAPAPTRK